MDHTRLLDFDIKRKYFRTELERADDGMRREDLAVHVRREHVFEDSFRELHRRSPDEWKNRFYIVFEGELVMCLCLRVLVWDRCRHLYHTLKINLRGPCPG